MSSSEYARTTAAKRKAKAAGKQFSKQPKGIASKVKDIGNIMAEDRLKENQFDKQGVNPFNAPIPGESLTTAPDMQKVWERPPQFTDEDDCMENLFRINK